MRCLALVLLWVAACDPAPKDPVAADPATKAEPAAKAAPPAKAEPPNTEPTPDPITHPCVVAGAQYDQALAAASDTCAADAECGCYEGGIGHKAGCGGVTNTASLEKLAAIAKAFHADKCPHTVQCAAWQCAPRCVDGHCVR